MDNTEIIGIEKSSEHNEITEVASTAIDYSEVGGARRYYKYLPARIADAYLRTLSDEDILSSRDSIALVDARVADLLKIVNSGESGKLWNILRETTFELKQAQLAGDKDGARGLLAKLLNLIEAGYNDYLAWREVFDLIESRRKLTESEQKRLISLQQVFTADQGIKLIRFILIIIRKHVKDPAILQAISDDISEKLATTLNPHSIF